ncbi:unnamed protein product [Blepharisma stoltei]|uniref:Cyclin-dependent kinase inhibitor domain-containing protein n=1 Tax=Blepharisma stoltei TaxID=1481888 RepID=A0AAU9JCI1_9CILI|nr:unnamed protein product [Blepharisma stoltei]
MSLFCEAREELENDLLNWMADIKRELTECAEERSAFYGFDFDTEIPRTNEDQRYQWEGLYSSSISKLRTSINSEPESTRSTLATLQNGVDEIREIAGLVLCISVEDDFLKDH